MYESTKQQAALDRFKSVDSLADHIFDKIPALDNGESSPDHFASGTDEGIAQHGSNVVPLFANNTQDTHSILAKTERLLGGLLHALEGADQRAQAPANSERDKSPNFATAPDISYQTAQRRQQLPDGVEILKSAPTTPSDETIMKSIRALMEEQEVEFKEMRVAEKREKAKQILAPLEPQEVFEEVPVVEQPKRRRNISRALVRFLDKGFRNYYFLAISLSGWCTLAMMVLIDPEVARALGFLSTLLLAAAFCMFNAKAAEAQARAFA